MEKDFFQEAIPEKALLSVSQLAAHHAGRLGKLVRVYLAAKKYSPEATHDIRTHSSKCAAAWRILRRTGADIDDNKSPKVLRQLRHCLGPLRDADIRIE